MTPASIPAPAQPQQSRAPRGTQRTEMADRKIWIKCIHSYLSLQLDYGLYLFISANFHVFYLVEAIFMHLSALFKS